jgi:hypothetical protein
LALKPYKTLLKAADGEFIVNKSRFIGYGCPCETEEEALAFLASIRTKHKDATHNCYAYIIGPNMGIMRYSDDGEPGGTAGMPIIEVMKARGVTNCAVVVTRYFGGILLGAGGLVRAYSQGAATALNAEVRLYDRLFSVPNPDDPQNTGDYKDYLNADSLTVIENAKLEPALADATLDERYQFERVGYFALDKASTPEKPVFNRAASLRDSWSKIAKK